MIHPSVFGVHVDDDGNLTSGYILYFDRLVPEYLPAEVRLDIAKKMRAALFMFSAWEQAHDTFITGPIDMRSIALAENVDEAEYNDAVWGFAYLVAHMMQAVSLAVCATLHAYGIERPMSVSNGKEIAEKMFEELSMHIRKLEESE